MIAAQSDIHPADPRQHRGGQKVFLDFAAFQLFGWHADGVAEAEKQRPMAQHRPRRSLEVAVADLGMDDIDKLLVNFRIVNA